MAHLHAIARRELQRLHHDEIAFPERARNIRRRHDRAGGTVADAATIEHPQGIRDHRSVEHLLGRDPVAKMRLRIARAVLVALPRDVCQGAPDLIDGVAMPDRIGAGELSKGPGSRAPRQIQILEGALGPLRQPRIAGVLQLLHTDCERNVARACRHCVHRTAQRLGTRRAEILDSCHGYVRKPQRH